jgi:hypothetical protein
VARKLAKDPVMQHIAGPVDLGGSTRFPLSSNSSLDYVQDVTRLVFGEDSFFIVLYGALNVGGLIGTEHNGIAVLWENQGKVVLIGYCRDNSYMRASAKQCAEHKRICAMTREQFRDFVNLYPGSQCKVMVAKLRAIVRPKLGYTAAGFTATRFDTIMDKVLFIEALIRFLCGHCDRDKFTRRIYDGLYLHLGHIAHYNMGGFYARWFEDLVNQIEFLKYHSSEQIFGDWRDVAEALKKWIAGPEGQTVLAHYENALVIRTETAERQQLENLKTKYETPNGEQAS